jgi:hypothetical protein
MLKRCEEAQSSGREVRLSQPGAQQLRDGTSTVALHLTGRRRPLDIGFPRRLIKLNCARNRDSGQSISIRSRACGVPEKEKPGRGERRASLRRACYALRSPIGAASVGRGGCVFKRNESIAGRQVWAQTAGAASPTRAGTHRASPRARYREVAAHPTLPRRGWARAE